MLRVAFYKQREQWGNKWTSGETILQGDNCYHWTLYSDYNNLINNNIPLNSQILWLKLKDR